MLAIFHYQQPNGRYIARCDTHPDWSSEAGSLQESRDLAAYSLKAHIAATTHFAHYEVPDVNRELKAARAA